MLTRTALRLHCLRQKKRMAVGLAEKGPVFVPPIILGVCGGSGSGKTTFCERLVGLLGAHQVIHLKQDNYYRDLAHLSFQERCLVNFDHPESVEFSLLQEHLEYLNDGYDIIAPSYNFSTHSREAFKQIISPKPIILVEGILLFANSTLAKQLHHKIFIDARDEIRYTRRLSRDVRERGRSHESVEWQFSSTVRPMHETFVEPHKNSADVVISGERPFEPALLSLYQTLSLEAQKRGFHL